MPWSRLSCDGEGPLGDGEGGDAERDQERDLLHLRGGDFAPRPRGALRQPSQRRQQADADADDDDPAGAQDAQRAEQLQREDQQRGRDRGVGEPRQGAGEFRHDPAPQPVAAEADAPRRCR